MSKEKFVAPVTVTVFHQLPRDAQGHNRKPDTVYAIFNWAFSLKLMGLLRMEVDSESDLFDIPG